MKTWMKHSLAAALVATIGVGASGAFAAPWGDCDGPRGGMDRMHRMDPAAMSEHMTQRLATLQTALSLKPEQAVAWEQFKSVMQDKARRMSEHMQAMRTQERPKTVPDRMERMESFAKERLASLQEVRKATDALYGGLDATQKKTFDEQFPMFGPRGMGRGEMGRGGKGGGHMGPGRMGPGMAPQGGPGSAT
ncbi:Spy/CpxP family protein refolding chaperone [Aromatoleum toluclasticum]|uniref:Spy/CpxP family protein refolding chaperone n=1 Tax=Aromatoleum toluclasticum TaxID=92003 RepID=UPI000379C50F|nr:Spy/CpxP family protein refolding chaperone [Aromatoleum toluclasticum]